jgi:Ca2+-binding RTX toxin-like protein
MNVVFLPIPPQPGQPVSTLDIFAPTTEALSGSAFADTLLGDDSTQEFIEASGGVLTGVDRINLISGLQAILGPGVTSFGAGNIILGGGGGDTITGRGGNDIIDGDAYLSVQLEAPNPTGPGTIRADSMAELQARAFAGTLDPGTINIVREIKYATGPNDVDTAVFSGRMANYTIGIGGLDGATFDGSIVVTDNVGLDGTDILRNIERLQFADQLVILDPRGNVLPQGLLTINDTTPTQGQVLTASAAGVTDPNNPGGGAVNPAVYFWQAETAPGSGVFTDIILGGSGPTFTVLPAQAGARLRVTATYTDALGVSETVFSAPTSPVININDAPVGQVLISDTTPAEGQILTAGKAFTDADGVTLTGPLATTFTYQWQSSTNGVNWTSLAGQTSETFAPAQAQVGQQIRVVVSYVDGFGTTETVTSAATAAVSDSLTGTGVADTLNGIGNANEIFLGLGGNDTINGNGGNDQINGGSGNDNLNGNDGNDVFIHTVGAGADIVNGGAGTDTLAIWGGAAAETLAVTWNGTALSVGGGSLTSVETVSANLQGGVDTISYAGSTAAVAINLAGTATGFTAITNIENATGGNGADTITGNIFNNTLNGGAGNDVLNGDQGDDTILGDLGNDTIIGGDGNDILTGGGGLNTFVFAPGFGNDTITSFDPNPSGTGQEFLDIRGMGITAANFATMVTITDLGVDTLVTIGGNTITIRGVDGVGANVITQTDFIL